MVYKGMILLLVAGFIGLFLIEGPNGEPIMSLDDFKPETPEVMELPRTPTKVYKWQDENGAWQFADKPVDVEGTEEMELDGDINIVPGFKAPRKTVVNEEKTRPNIPSGLTSVSPEKISEMMDTVNNLQETVDQRKADVDKVGDN